MKKSKLCSEKKTIYQVEIIREKNKTFLAKVTYCFCYQMLWAYSFKTPKSVDSFHKTLKRMKRRFRTNRITEKMGFPQKRDLSCFQSRKLF